MRPADALAAALLAVIGFGGAPGAAATGSDLYHAGLKALAEGDCEAARRNFDAFFAQNPGYVRPRPHTFYLDVLRAVGACGGTFSVSGIGQDGGQPPPLPGEPPPVE